MRSGVQGLNALFSQMRRQTRLLKLSRSFGLAVALFAVLSLGLGIGFWHIDAPGTESTCPICHVAYSPAMPGAPVQVPTTLAAVASLAVPQIRDVLPAPAAPNAPPRAPPI